MGVDEIEVAPGLWATRHFALWLKEEGAVAISDLHLGFEAALAEQGVSIPRFQRREIFERLPRLLLPGTTPRRLHARAVPTERSRRTTHAREGAQHGLRG